MFWLIFACATPSEEQPAPVEEARSLAQELYAGEQGAAARRYGDRTRILLWLKKLQAKPDLLEHLKNSSLAVIAGQRELQQREAEAERVEAEQLMPLYNGLSAALLREPVDEAEIASLTDALAAAKKQRMAQDESRLQYLRQTLDEAQNWIDRLDPDQQKVMQQALFFLRQPVSPQLSPVYYNALVGVAWPADSFASLRRLSPGPEAEDPLDIGGLWTYDEGATVATEAITGLKLQVLVALALQQPELVPSIEVFQGTRKSDDFGAPP
ncbi:MAG TPA: hypothetical protein PKY30_12740 [Myxococcota bacterium]|nr:hypothetical protein [Myxococcota bacterium]HNH47903.1 hypothetical protein [Myxococcota bacterium]